jgi:hypothetical protein
MAEATTLVLSELEIEAAIGALANCGANSSGNYHTLIEHFRDPQLANAAKAALGRLRGSA